MPRTHLLRSAGHRFAMVFLALAVGTPVDAQVLPKGYETLSHAAIAESLKVLKTLEAHVKKNKKDAAAFHRLGMVAFVIEQRARRANPPQGVVPWKIRPIADKAFQTALELEPNNTRHWLALGRFYTTGDGNAERLPRIYYDRGIQLAREQRDTAMVATMGMELGTLHWRHSERVWRGGAEPAGELIPTMREPSGARGVTRGDVGQARAAVAATDLSNPAPGEPGLAVRFPVPTTVTGAAGRDSFYAAPVLLSSATRRITEALNPWGGITAESFYLNAEAYVSEAHDIRPADRAIFRRLAGVYALEDRWADLLGLAESQIAGARDDPWGWMALGLAQHRKRESAKARASFDSAFARFSLAERARLDRIDRVLSPTDAERHARSDSVTKARTANALWHLADPLWSQNEEDPRTEFFARLAYAELRFTHWDGAVNGADTPQGRLYVRYGPPDDVRGTFWLYDSGIALSLCMRLGSPMIWGADAFRASEIGTACDSDLRLLGEVLAWQPSNWDNIAVVRIDSIPSQVARFRAPADSVDMYFAGFAPVDAMRNVRSENSVMRADFWLFAWNSPFARQRAIVPLDSAAIILRERVPSGRYHYRLESTVPGALAAGRTSANLTLGPDSASGFATRGFGMSDILLASRADANGVARRWNDLAITPRVGSLSRPAEVALVWETYDLASRGGDAQYTVTLTLERPRDRSRVGRITARIISGIAGAVGADVGPDAFTLRFDRTVRHADAVLENVVVGFGDTPAGNYTLRISVADNVSGRTTQRAVPLVIAER